MSTLTIGQVARQARVNVETVRYYERCGLIDQPPRPRSGYRQYAPETADRIRFIKRAQELGFALDEIAELLALRVDRETACDEVRAQAERKIADIEGRIRGLRRISQTLGELVEACRENRTTSACPILETLEREGE